MRNTASLKKEYAERIAPALKSQFHYSSSMQVPVLKKIVINQGLGMGKHGLSRGHRSHGIGYTYLSL